MWIQEAVDMMPVSRRESVKTKIFSRTKRVGECWEWTGARAGLGYGVMRLFEAGANFGVHRIVYAIKIGSIPEGMFVCHRCDNPPCVNPEHLFLGTPLDNMLDKIGKGRDASPRGEGHHNAKLSENDVVEIMRLAGYGETQASLAARYGVDEATVNCIVSRENWRWLDIPEDAALLLENRRRLKKLSDEDVLEILRSIGRGETHESVGKRFSISQGYVTTLVSRRKRSGVRLPEDVEKGLSGRRLATKLTTEQSKEIVELYGRGGISQSEIATRYGVTQSRVSSLVSAARAAKT